MEGSKAIRIFIVEVVDVLVSSGLRFSTGTLEEGTDKESMEGTWVR